MPCGRARTYPPCTSFTPSIEFLATRWKAAGGTVCKRLFTTPDSPLWYIFAPPLTHSTVKKERQPGVPVPVGHSRDAKNTRLPSEGIDPARRLREAAALRSLPYLGEGHPSIFRFSSTPPFVPPREWIPSAEDHTAHPSTDASIYHNGMHVCSPLQAAPYRGNQARNRRGVHWTPCQAAHGQDMFRRREHWWWQTWGTSASPLQSGAKHAVRLVTRGYITNVSYVPDSIHDTGTRSLSVLCCIPVNP